MGEQWYRDFDRNFVPREPHINLMRAMIVAHHEGGLFYDGDRGAVGPEVMWRWLRDTVPASGRVINELIQAGVIDDYRWNGWKDGPGDVDTHAFTEDGLAWFVEFSGKTLPDLSDWDAANAFFDAWGAELAPTIRRRGEPQAAGVKQGSVFEKKDAYTEKEAFDARHMIAQAVLKGELTVRQGAAHKAWVTMRTTLKEEAA